MAKPPARVKQKELDEGRRPWEKQTWETSPAFNAFALYRDLGLARSLSKAASALVETVAGERKHNSVQTQMSEWSSKHRWVERAEAYDMHLDERFREQREGRIGRQNRRYETLAATLSAGLLRRVSVDEFDGVAQPVDLNELDADGVGRLLVNLQRVERLATGQATENLKGAFMITSGEMERISRDLVQGLMQFIDAERQPLAAQWVMSYAQTGQVAA